MQPAPREASPYNTVDPKNNFLQKMIWRNWIFISVPIILLILAVPLAILLTPWLFFVCFFGALFTGILFYVMLGSNQDKLILWYRETIVTETIKSIDPSINYEPKSFFISAELNYSGLLEKTPNVCYGENYFEKRETNYVWELAGAHAHKQTTKISGGRVPRQITSAEYLIHGLFYKFSLPKSFKTNIIIRQDQERGLFGILQENPEYLYNSFYPVSFSNQKFEKQFEVYAQDDLEARKIVDEDLQSLLLYFVRIYHKKVQLSMIDNFVYLTIDSGRRYFKPGIILHHHSKSLKRAKDEANRILHIPEKMNPWLLNYFSKYS